ncbi:MAG: fumarylacetoacetate hydrolase family protein [Bacillota bacterium]
MKIVRIWDGTKVSYGILDISSVIPIEGNIYGEYQLSKKEYTLSEVQLLVPCEPTKIICIGLNYHDHAKEVSLPIPKEPVVFLKPPSTLTASGSNIVYPVQCNRLDYEAELAIIIGTVVKDIKPTEVMDCVFGYTCANDITARNLQPLDGQWTVAKSFDTFCPIGPYIETEISPDSLDIKLWLNGNIKQNSNTSQMIFDVPYLVSYLSKIMTLFPGDIIITGTPSGVGPMNPGDTVEVEITGLGKLVNRVVSK